MMELFEEITLKNNHYIYVDSIFLINIYYFIINIRLLNDMVRDTLLLFDA